MRLIGGIVLGLLLFFPGITLLQWIAEDLLGQPMTVTDGCLVMIMILLSVIIVTRLHRDQSQQQPRRPTRQSPTSGTQPQPYRRTPRDPSASRRPSRPTRSERYPP